MADIAEWELTQVIDAECERADAYHSRSGSREHNSYVDEFLTFPQQPIPELDVDVFNLDKAMDEMQIDLYKLSLPSTTQPKPVIRINITQWQMLAGMATAVRSNRQLSSKQQQWLSTNWSGGAKAFVDDLTSVKGHVIVKLLNKIVAELNQHLTFGKNDDKH